MNTQLWKRVLNRIIDSLGEGMVMTDPVAYTYYLQCKAWAEGETVPNAAEQARAGVSPARVAARRRLVVLEAPSKELTTVAVGGDG